MEAKDYMEKRESLINKAESLINDDDIDGATGIMDEISALDERYDRESKAFANLAAIRGDNVGKGMSNISDTSLKVDAKTATYEDAFTQYIIGASLSSEQQSIFNKVNNISNTVTVSEQQIRVPEVYVEQIWTEIGEQHPIFADARPTYIKGFLTITKDNDTKSAQWYDEATVVDADDVSTTEITLHGCELAKAVKVSWRFKSMTAEQYRDYILDKIAEKMGNALANGMATGKGVSANNEWKPEPKGIITAIKDTDQFVSANGDITYADIVNLFSKIKSGYDKTIYANSTTIWNKLAMILDGNGRPIFMPNGIDGGVGKILGATVKEEDSVTNGILIGDVARGYAININENITLHTEDRTLDRETIYMEYAVVDGTVVTEKAFAYLELGSAETAGIVSED